MKILFTILNFLLYYCLYSQPVISSFFPEAGSTGTLVKINGSGFSSNTKDNIVFFGAVRATVTAAASTSISAIVPPSASYQPITVTTAGLTAYARKPFSVIFNCGIFNANTFPVRTDSAAPNYTLSMAVKDLDNDGKPEIITGGYGFSIFKNTSSINSFSLQPSLTWGNSQFNEYIIMDDMDGDGMPDVIVPNWTPNDTSSVYVLKNTSGGGAISFDSPVKSYTKGGYGVVTADLDGDGKPDIVSSGESSPFLSIQRNTTTGGILSFAPEIVYSADNYSRGVAIGYIDEDDKPDILVANQSNQSFSVFINHSTSGNILFSPKINFSTTPGGSPESVAVADVDGDGKSDVIVTNNNSFSVNTISVFRNISNGGTVAFDTRLDLTTDNKWNNYHLAISDIDGDGKPDIASNNQSNSLISLFRNTSTIGSCSFEPKLDIASASYTRRPLCISDIDGDGRPDICEAGNNIISLFHNNPGVPKIISFTPAEACEGSIVAISGENFTGISGVSFGGTAATAFTILSSSLITATVGAGASGNVSIVSPCGNDQLGGFSFNKATVTAGVSISSSAMDKCPGTPVTFIAVPTNGGSSPVYQWQINEVNTGTGASTFMATTLKEGDSVKVIMTSALACVTGSPATSNTIVMEVLPSLTATVNITANATAICPGGSVTFVAKATNAGPQPEFDWLVNGIATGINSDIFTTTSLNNNDSVKCVLMSNYPCMGNSKVTSNSITVIAGSAVVPQISILASASNICKGTVVTFNATPINEGIAPIYQWRVNRINVGNNNVLFTTNLLKEGDVVTCSITNTISCNPVKTAASNEILMHVDKSSSPSLIISTSANNICAHTQVTFTAKTSDVVSAVNYRWKLNDNSVGEDNEIFSTDALSNSDRVYCVMNTLAGCFLNQLINSDTITMIVKPVPEISFNTSNAVIKQGGNVQLIATITGGYDSFLWTPSAGLNSFKVLNPVANPLVNTTYNLNVVSGDCAADKSVTVTVLTDVYIPSSFSPNGDGINDFFRIPPGTSFQLDNFYIYDKGGNLIFKTSDISKGWNGFYKGIAVAAGNYVYMIKGTSNSKKLLLKGNILLVR